jgi:hypothetical protein
MDKKPLIGVSICAMVFLVMGSLSNVVGYQSVQSSNQQIINEEVNRKELLFQTIVNIANNKEIQRIILQSQMMSGKLLDSDAKLPTPITKQQLRQMYFIGMILSKIISKTRMQSMVGKYQFNNQEMQKEINAVIEKDALLRGEITQLQNSECDCEKNINGEKISMIDSTGTQIICVFLFIVMTAMIVLSIPFIIIFEFLINIDLVLLPLLMLTIEVLAIGLPFYIALFLYDTFSCAEVFPKRTVSV